MDLLRWVRKHHFLDLEEAMEVMEVVSVEDIMASEEDIMALEEVIGVGDEIRIL
jgi:hypothetical protein